MRRTILLLTALIAVVALCGASLTVTGAGPAQAQTTSTGDAYSWGWSRYGELGIGVSGSDQFRNKPVKISGLTGVAEVAANDASSLARKGDGTVWGWGANTSGQLGDGTRTQRNTPVQVKNKDGTPFTGVLDVDSNSWFENGSFSLAIVSDGTADGVANDGTVWGWGDNEYGVLGDGTTTQRNNPVQVPGLTDVTEVAAGTGFSLALKSDGTVWAWGRGYDWQLGRDLGGESYDTTPKQVPGVTGVKDISAGTYAVALKNDGSVWQWGPFPGTGTDGAPPEMVSGLSSGVRSISAGDSTYSMAVKTDGTVWGWGDNEYGVLGDGTKVSRTTPVQVKNLSGAIAVEAGAYHTLAAKSNGTMWGWGRSKYGQLGNGTGDGFTDTASYTPVKVLNISGPVSFSAGDNHSLAVAVPNTTTPTLQTFEENNRDYVDYKDWEYYKAADANFYGGYYSADNTKGATATFRFNGTSVNWGTSKGPNRGITDVYLDGVKVKSFDGFSSTQQHNVSGFSRSGLTSGLHTLRLVVTGNRNAASTGTWTLIDRFVVDGSSRDENSAYVAYGPWRGGLNSNASGGAVRLSRSTSMPIYFGYYKSFRGPSVELITQKSPGRGTATIKVYDWETDALVKTVSPNLYSATTQWKVPVTITGLDPAKRYYMTVSSADSSKDVVVDAFRAVPY